MGLVVALAHRRDRIDGGLIGHGGQAADRGFHGLGEVRRIHGHRDIERAQVAGDVVADLLVGQIRVEQRLVVDLEDLRAQVRHVDAPGLHRVGTVHRVLEHDVRVAGLELQLSQRLEELAGADLLFPDPGILHHLLVVLRDRDVAEGLAVNALDVVRREQVHVLVALSQLEGNVRNHHAEREGLNADLLVGVFALGIQKAQDIRVVGVEVDRASALAGAQLVGVGEGVLQKLHHRDHARGLVLDVLNRRALFADVGQQKRHAAAALGQLQRGVDRAADGLHVVLDAQQEAGDELAALGLAGVEEGRRRRLEAAGHDLIDKLLRQAGIAVCEEQCRHGHAVLEALEVAAAIESLQRVAGVVLVRAQEGLEAELVAVGALEQVLHEGEVVPIEHFPLVVLVVQQVADLFFQVVEVDGVLIDVLEEELVRRLAVLFELDLPVFVVQVQHRVERVVVELLFGVDRFSDVLA